MVTLSLRLSLVHASDWVIRVDWKKQEVHIKLSFSLLHYLKRKLLKHKVIPLFPKPKKGASMNGSEVQNFIASGGSFLNKENCRFKVHKSVSLQSSAETE